MLTRYCRRGMTKRMTHQQVISRLKKMQGKRTLQVFGAEIGVTAGYLSDVYAGKRGLGEVLLGYLRLVKNPPTYSEVDE